MELVNIAYFSFSVFLNLSVMLRQRFSRYCVLSNEFDVYFILLFVTNIKMELLLEFATFIFEIGLLPVLYIV